MIAQSIVPGSGGAASLRGQEAEGGFEKGSPKRLPVVAKVGGEGCRLSEEGPKGTAKAGTRPSTFQCCTAAPR